MARARGGDVGHAVRGHDLGEVLLARGLAGGRRAGAREVRRRRGLLRAGVHVALVVEADVEEVLVALGRRRQALEADVVGAAVAGEHEHLRVALALRIERAAQPGGGGRARLERRLVDRDLQRAHRLRPGDDRHARRRDHRDRVRAHRGEDVPRGQRVDAAGAGRVARAQHRVLLKVEAHHRGHLAHTGPGCGSLARAVRTNSTIFAGGTFTPPTPASSRARAARRHAVERGAQLLVQDAAGAGRVVAVEHHDVAHARERRAQRGDRQRPEQAHLRRARPPPRVAHRVDRFARGAAHAAHRDDDRVRAVAAVALDARPSRARSARATRDRPRRAAAARASIASSIAWRWR